MIKRTIAQLAVIGLVASTLSAAAEQKPKVKEPELPKQLVSAGTVYHTLSERETQIVFTSDAPLENIVGKSNSVVGYLVQGPETSPASLKGAHWVLPVESLATGIPLRDSHMTGSEWLDAKEFPTIEFKLEKVEDAKSIKSGDGFSTWSVTLVGKMTLHGVTKDIRVEGSTLSFLKESERTKSIAPGDLVFLKSSYKVKLSDFGITHKDVPDKVSDEIVLNQMLRMSSVLPEQPERAGGPA